MISETLLKALQERMRKLSGISSTHTVHSAELRAALERARLAEATETVRRAEAIKESQRLMAEIKELRDHIEDLMHSPEDPTLVSGLKEELTELESMRREIDRQIELSSSHRHEAVENAARELESAEQARRHIVDQAMRLREHIEKLSHS